MGATSCFKLVLKSDSNFDVKVERVTSIFVQVTDVCPAQFFTPPVFQVQTFCFERYDI